jgi:hypothetical protein
VAWILAVIAVALLVVPPPTRKIGLAILAVVFCVFLTIVLVNRRTVMPPPAIDARAPVAAAGGSRRFDFDQYEQDKKDREDPQARNRIALSEVRFGELRPMPGLASGTLESIRARIYNDSDRFTLTNYAYTLVVQDCLPATSGDAHDPKCTTVFDQRGLASATVPAHQARDVEIEITGDPATRTAPFKLLGTPHIELEPTGTRAYTLPERP